MLISPSPIALPRFFMTRPHFDKIVLTNTEQTGISWFNPSDHTQPYPWSFAVTPGNPSVNYADIVQLIDLGIENQYPYETLFLSTPTTSGIPGYELMMVDAAGADLFDLFIPSHTRPAHANGMYLVQDYGDGYTYSRNIAGFYLVWQFANQSGYGIAPPW